MRLLFSKKKADIEEGVHTVQDYQCVCLCVSEGEDDGLMVEWFNLIRNKQVAMRRESELVYM